MTEIHDLAQVRARRARAAGPPNRDPDFVATGWLRGGEIDWLHTSFPGSPPLHVRTLNLIDAAWLVGTDPTATGERPAFWWLVDDHGHQVFLTNPGLFAVSSWARAWWFVRAWWRVTRKCASVAWRMSRGQTNAKG
ncbi:hypothetical protein [Luteimonas saliphila]|uniref:hypothetical protein n=1 Tax=Luteimonas saliphila TaxID=2804919 RepID=UPI00192D5F94|nr:hypothetical protein [Luteimonas saliphila]